MHPMFNRLRLIVSLAHHVANAELIVHRRGMRPLHVGFHDEADVGTCQFRQMLMSRTCPIRVEVTHRLAGVEVGGALEPLEGDLYRACIDGREHRVFATFLNPDLVFSLVESLECDPDAATNVTATLRPDPGLGVTTVIVGVDDPALEARIDELARAAYDACLVEELLISAGADHRSADQPPAHVNPHHNEESC